MNIGILGSGNMGRALGVRLAMAGHSVTFGARRRAQAEAAAALANATAADLIEAASASDVVIWTIRDASVAAALAEEGALDGKVIIDLNNRSYADDVQGGAWFEESLAEQLQSAAPTAKVVKAFNTLAMEAFDTSKSALEAAGAGSFIAGDDAGAKALVSKLVRDLGFTPIDLGAGPTALRAAEALGDVIRLLMIDGGLGGRAALGLQRLPAPDLNVVGDRAESNYT